MTIHYGTGDALRAERIAVQARKIDKYIIKTGSSSHRIQATKLHGSAYCVIELPLRTAIKSSK